MDMRRIPYYCSSVLLWIHVAGAIVPPPTNVTLLCHNMQNILSWGYGQSEDGLRLKVYVRSLSRSPEPFLVNSPTMSFNLSQFSDPDEDYMVQVSAVKGNEESQSIPEDGIVYSYFKHSSAPKICSLDLPSVDVTTFEENHLQFSFTHPGVIYPTSRKKKGPESQDSLPVFDYHVDVLNQESHPYSCSEEKCEDKLHVHGTEKSYCLNISGEMSKMSVQATKTYCFEPLKAAGINPVAYIVPIVLVVLLVVLTGAMMFVKKTRHNLWTSPPESLHFPEKNNQQNHAAQDNMDCTFVQLEPSSPVPLIPTDQDTSNNSCIYRDEVRLPLGVPDNENEPEEAAAAGDGYTQGNCLDDDDEQQEKEKPPPSEYESRPKLNMP
uniref:Fibronectin type-III domain-containing protein n=1 Tax=Neogobius melanostomus TaxID=47308 RepID=A0A8C6UX59_9GOBI